MKMKNFSKNSQEFGKCLRLGEKYFLYGIQDTDTKGVLMKEWDDMVQDCCVKAVTDSDLNTAPSVDGGLTITPVFKKWCRVVGVNHTLDKLRRYNIMQKVFVELTDDDLSQYEISNIDCAMDSLMMEEYKRVLLTVDSQKRDVFLMHVENNIPLKDISNLTGCSYATTKRYYEEVKNTIKESFNA